ncbi:hypothetical protein [Clostridium sartagoforme]|nr:hypothetical protein [Clostridium sartagoforme]
MCINASIVMVVNYLILGIVVSDGDGYSLKRSSDVLSINKPITRFT